MTLMGDMLKEEVSSKSRSKRRREGYLTCIPSYGMTLTSGMYDSTGCYDWARLRFDSRLVMSFVLDQ